MPKDATKNIDRYKIRGGQLNEFDFHQNQENLAPPKPKKGTKEKIAPMRGATAKKLAAKKAAKKK